MKSPVKNLVRALRLPFITASALPFIFGSFIDRSHFNKIVFSLGLISAVSTHLSSNLINDFADSDSGADWQDKDFYGFFGGSKLIQDGTFSKWFYLRLAAAFAVISFLAALVLAIILNNIFILCAFSVIMFLGWAYSVKPLQFSYNRLGEIIIFILFGPALVMGGYFLQTGIFPDLKSFMLSLPLGFLTAAILFVNEIPDLRDDENVHKFTWVNIVGGKRAYLLYCVLIFLAFLSIVLNICYRFIGPAALVSLFLIFAAAKAATILKRCHEDKKILVKSSQLTIAIQALVSLILIVAVIL